MHRWFRICALFALAASAQTGFAAEESKAEVKDVATLRQLLEQQSKQIDALSQKVDHLSNLIEASHPSPTPTVTLSNTTAAAAEPVAAKAEPVEPAATATSGSASPSTAAASAAGTPDPTLPRYIVKKGENLTSIARHHGTTVPELLKINKIEDERKLQIGQTIILPKPSASPSEQTATPKTDTQ